MQSNFLTRSAALCPVIKPLGYSGSKPRAGHAKGLRDPVFGDRFLGIVDFEMTLTAAPRATGSAAWADALLLSFAQAGYIQAEVDQQPYAQGFMPVMQVYLAKSFGLAPTDINTGNSLVMPAQADSVIALSQQGLR